MSESSVQVNSSPSINVADQLRQIGPSLPPTDIQSGVFPAAQSDFDHVTPPQPLAPETAPTPVSTLSSPSFDSDQIVVLSGFSSSTLLAFATGLCLTVALWLIFLSL